MALQNISSALSVSFYFQRNRIRIIFSPKFFKFNEDHVTLNSLVLSFELLRY